MNAALQMMLDKKKAGIPELLWSAMQYSLLAGGKRVRPVLMLECFAACGGQQDILSAAMSIECMHTYSLIHDDLPSMDNDDLRRGKPTCHRRFDEATAILAADALQSLSFELLAVQRGDNNLRISLIQALAQASGGAGMVGGQVLDMQAEAGRVENVDEVEHIHALKTGALLRYSCEAGALLAGADAVQLEICSSYGRAVGLLFQIADDMLDATASSEALGKSAGKDAAQHKATYVSLLGLKGARELAEQAHGKALEAASLLGEHGDILKQLATYIMEREQ
ncbi:MAG: polyprenyl synthetase family protein [Mariprofundaceae bacterium]|nr:polyprenyl synthetase family protein [Mariprofundaceae bacterium]